MRTKHAHFDVYRGGQLRMWVDVERDTLDGCRVFFTLKDDIADSDAQAYIEKVSGAEIVHVGNRAEWVVDEADIASLPENHFRYVWQVWFEDPEGYATPLETGTIRVLPSINQVL